MTEAATLLNPSSSPQGRLIAQISAILEPLGYEVVHLEVQTHRQKVLRLFIDHTQSGLGAIGEEDCAKVSRALDEPLDQMPEVDAIFHGTPYELEVSSPGVDRPLRQPKDFLRFEGKEARIHTFRPLSGEEIENTEHQQKNPKQKNFLGILKGLKSSPSADPESTKILLQLSDSGDSGKPGKKGKAKKKSKAARDLDVLKTEAEEEKEAALRSLVAIPFSLISKANLEPRFEGIDEVELDLDLGEAGEPSDDHTERTKDRSRL